MPVDIFGPLTAEDEFGFICNSDQVILHGVTQQPGEKADGYHPTQLLHKCIYHHSVFHIRIIRMLSVKGTGVWNEIAAPIREYNTYCTLKINLKVSEKKSDWPN